MDTDQARQIEKLNKKIKYLSVLQEVNKAVTSKLDFDEVVKITVDSIERIMGYKGGALSLIDDTGEKMYVYAASGSKLAKLVEATLTRVKPLREYAVDLRSAEENFTIKAAKYGKVYMDNDLANFISPSPVPSSIAHIIQKTTGIGSLVAIPIVIRGKIKGVLDFILEREEKDITEDEKETMISFARQAGIGMENALLYKESRTQYQDLLVLRRIADLITATLDVQKVGQEIVDSVTFKLNFVLGILMLVDQEADELYPLAVSKTAGITATLRLLGPLAKLRVSLSNHQNLVVQAVREQKIKGTDRLEEVFTPVLSSRITQKIQKINRVNGGMILPLVAQGKVLGALGIGLDKPVGAVTEQERQTMSTLANEAGSAINNALLFERTKRFTVELTEKVEQATSELRVANTKLTKLDQAKSDFISIASHQLRTPLSAIKGYLSMVVDGDYGIVADKVGQVLTRVYNSNERLIALVNNMLNISRIESGRIQFHPQPLQLELVINDVIGEIGPEARARQVQLIFKPLIRQSRKVQADDKIIHEVLNNLVDNAIKYTPHGSVTISLHPKANMLEVRVKDTGIGVAPDDLPRLFKKFSRGQDVYKDYAIGSGLGLYVVKQMVEMHGGTVGVESAGTGKGSTFWFTVPWA